MTATVRINGVADSAHNKDYMVATFENGDFQFYAAGNNGKEMAQMAKDIGGHLFIKEYGIFKLV